MKWCLRACIVVAVIAFWAGYFTAKPSVTKVKTAPVFVVETIPVTDTTVVLRWRRDTKLERELVRLRNILQEREGLISKLTSDISVLEAKTRFITDSVTLAELKQFGGMLLVTFNRGGVGVWGVRNGVLTQWYGKTNKNRWNLSVGERGVVMRQTRFPPVGVGVWARYYTAYDRLQLNTPVVGASIFTVTKPITWRVGVSSKREIEVGVELGWEF